MRKAHKYAIKGAISVGSITTILNLAKQLDEISEDPTKKIDWRDLFISAGKGVLVGGTGGYVIGAIEDYQNSQEKPLNTDAFLYSLADKLKLKKDNFTLQQLEQKADMLIVMLKNEYCDDLATDPFRIGSTQKGTALRSKFDIDIALSFRKNSFRSTAAMFDHLAEFLKSKEGKLSIIRTRVQHVSIGVYFNFNNREYKIDIVPKKRSSDSKRNSSGYLYVNDPNIWRDNSSYTKTDFNALNKVRFSETQKKVIIILKHWKIKNDLPLSSHLLENLVLDAYERNRYTIPTNLTDKVVMVFDHIVNKLDIAVIRSIENSNNILTDISKDDKAIIISACRNAVQEFEYQPNSILKIFEK